MGPWTGHWKARERTVAPKSDPHVAQTTKIVQNCVKWSSTTLLLGTIELQMDSEYEKLRRMLLDLQ